MRVFRENGERFNPAEISAWAKKTYGACLTDGFSEFRNSTGGVRENSGFIASFIEFVGGAAWYLPQTGGSSLEWNTAPVPPDCDARDVVFVFSMATGNGSPLPQPTGHFDLYGNGRYLLSFRIVKHREIWTGEAGSAFCFDVRRLEAAPPGMALCLDDVIASDSFVAFGLGFLKVPIDLVGRGQPLRLKVEARSPVPSKRFFKLDNARQLVGRANIYQGLEQVCSERTHAALGEHKVFFGDIHTHSGESPAGPEHGCGAGTAEDNYWYARHVANLDVYSLTDHDCFMDEPLWRREMRLADEQCEPGKFVTLPAFEWSSCMYGHRNVYYLHSDNPFFLGKHGRDYWLKDVESPVDLWSHLDDLARRDRPAITVPHHPTASSHPLSWDFYHPGYDRLVELYSCWGRHEFPENPYKGYGSDRFEDLYVQRALGRGLRLGFMASSDGHDGHPGDAQSPHTKHHHLYHHLGSGRVAILANELTREAVFDSLQRRLCYATTGEPIVLGFRLNDHPMGSELCRDESGEHPLLSVRCLACTHIESVEIVKNGRVVQSGVEPQTYNTLELEWIDEEGLDPAENYYYVRVTQRDGEMAWSSPIWVSDEPTPPHDIPAPPTAPR